MRIALVLAASTGGIGRHVAGLAPRLARRGHQVLIFCPPETARTHRFDDPGLAALDIGVRPLVELTRARAADVVHAHGYKAIALAGSLVRPFGPPLVGSWHNAVLATGRAGQIGRLLQRYSARTADLTLGASSDLVDLALASGAGRARFSPVAPPRPPAMAHSRAETRAAVRARLGAGDRTVVLSVGRLAAQKNYPLLCDVAARLTTRAIEFWVAGEGPERAGIEQRIAAERLPIRLLGARSDIGELLVAADLFVLTSSWEARALVAQEALAAGVPLIGPAVGGLPELVGEAGVLVRPGDDAAMADSISRAIERLIEDPEAAGRLRVAGPVQAARWPDEEAVAADVEHAYRSVAL